MAQVHRQYKYLAHKAFPGLQGEAKQHLTLQSYLRQLDQPQVVFSIQQKCWATLDEAVLLTLEMEAYMLPLTQTNMISAI